MTAFLGVTIVSYLLGSIPFGLVVARGLAGRTPDPGERHLGAANRDRQWASRAAALPWRGTSSRGPCLCCWPPLATPFGPR